MAPVGGERCWCGAVDREPLRADYGLCRSCGTLVFSELYDGADYVSSEPSGFYGDRYWQQHVPDRLGLPGLEERARSDLSERAVFHLTRILERLAPGARVLELGCGAGSLTYLLGGAGFEASGVELGPAAIELARRHFGVEVHRGPLAEREPGGTFDAIVAIDVLEHLPEPLATVELCARRLARGGLLFLQTPCYRGDGPDWQMLLPREHLFLFTEDSIRRLLSAAGFAAVEVRDSLFPYDMWATAALDEHLPHRPDPLAGVSPATVALIDARDANLRAAGERDAIDDDRRSKEAVNERLGSKLAAARGDQRAKEELLRRQDDELRRVHRDQDAKAALIDRLDGELEELRRDQTAKGDLIERLTADLDSIRRDQAAKGDLIERLTADLDTVRRDQSAKSDLIERLTPELEEVRDDHAARGELIERLSLELEEVRGDQAAKETLIGRLDGELGAAATRIESLEAELRRTGGELRQIRDDRLYRWLRAARARLGGGQP